MTSLNIGLLWHSMASGNLGVVALTFSQIAIVREAAEAAGQRVKIKVFGWQLDGAIPTPPEFSDIEYIGLDAKQLLNPKSAFHKALSTCQVVLDVGEGDSFSDIYGLKRLLYLSLSKRFAGAAGRKLILSPQTIGPFSTAASRVLARWALTSATRVFARDPLSKEWLDQNGQAEWLLIRLRRCPAILHLDRECRSSRCGRRAADLASGRIQRQPSRQGASDDTPRQGPCPARCG